jgi:uncharacterized DUF497 family protein
LNEREIQFKWNDVKATQNLRKHGVSFDLAHTVFADRYILTVADLEHSEAEERWLSIGSASNGTILSVVYLWRELASTTVIRLISARKASMTEIHQYQMSI